MVLFSNLNQANSVDISVIVKLDKFALEIVR